MANKHTAKRISGGHYMYRGFQIICIGYYNPEHRVCWEAVDEHGCGFAHSNSLKDILILIKVNMGTPVLTLIIQNY